MFDLHDKDGTGYLRHIGLDFITFGQVQTIVVRFNMTAQTVRWEAHPSGLSGTETGINTAFAYGGKSACYIGRSSWPEDNVLFHGDISHVYVYGNRLLSDAEVLTIRTTLDPPPSPPPLPPPSPPPVPGTCAHCSLP